MDDVQSATSCAESSRKSDPQTFSGNPAYVSSDSGIDTTPSGRSAADDGFASFSTSFP